LKLAMNWRVQSDGKRIHSNGLRRRQLSMIQVSLVTQMHKTRMFLPPIPDVVSGSYDLYNPQVWLVSVPRDSLHITGDFDACTVPIVKAAIRRAGRILEIPQDRIVVPVHELQIHQIREKFPEVEILPDEYSLPASAQQSIRLVLRPQSLLPPYSSAQGR